MTRSAKASPFRAPQDAGYSDRMAEGYARDKHSRDGRRLRRRKACKGGRFNPDMTRRRFFGRIGDEDLIPNRG